MAFSLLTATPPSLHCRVHRRTKHDAGKVMDRRQLELTLARQRRKTKSPPQKTSILTRISFLIITKGLMCENSLSVLLKYSFGRSVIRGRLGMCEVECTMDLTFQEVKSRSSFISSDEN